MNLPPSGQRPTYVNLRPLQESTDVDPPWPPGVHGRGLSTHREVHICGPEPHPEVQISGPETPLGSPRTWTLNPPGGSHM